MKFVINLVNNLKLLNGDLWSNVQKLLKNVIV